MRMRFFFGEVVDYQSIKAINLYKFLLYIFLFTFNKASSQDDISIYYAWNNRVDQMEPSSEMASLPILLNGKNYRIVKIEGFKGNNISKIVVNSRNTGISIYELPIMIDRTNHKVLDLVNPLTAGTNLLDRSSTKYFLLEFTGKKTGKANAQITFSTRNKTYEIKQNVFVSTKQKEFLSLNVWSYFDYSFIIKGLKNDVIKDLQQRNVNTLVIPPYILPYIGPGPISNEALQSLSNYLKGTSDKFQHYILYLGFNEDFSRAEDKNWQRYFLAWYSSIVKVFRDVGIPEAKIMFCPVDEPEKNNIKYIRYFKEFYRSQGISNKLFVTVGRAEVFELLEFADIAQVYTTRPGMLEQLKNTKNIRSEIWIYEIKTSGRDFSALGYKNIGVQTYYVNGKGLGVWCYADADRAFTENVRKNFLQSSRGSWEIPITTVNRDYSLIYRKNNILYPSLRWIGLSYSMDEYSFLKYYNSKKGRAATDILIKKILSEKITTKELEQLKIDIL